jgi:tetratricopeptide (TPR) repeat protein
MGNQIALRPAGNRADSSHKIYVLFLLVILPALYFFPFAGHSELCFLAAALLAIFLVSLCIKPEAKSGRLYSVEELVRHGREAGRQGDGVRAEQCYCQAIFRLVNAGKMARAAELFEEFFMRYRRVFAPRMQLELARELCLQGKYLLAARSLQKLVQDWPQVFRHSDRHFLEQAYLHLARIYAEKLGLPALAADCYFEFLDRFPKSAHRETALYQLQLLDGKQKIAL